MSTRIILFLCLALLTSPESLHASAKKAELITGVDLNRLMDGLVEKEVSIVRHGLRRRGVSYLLMKNNKSIGTATVGVFGDPNEALSIFRDHLLRTSVRPKETLSDDLGNRSVRWWTDRLEGFTRILFMRDNAVVDVHLFLDRFIEIGGAASATMNIAKAIDDALIEGTRGVHRAPTVHMPRILKVQTHEEILTGTTVEIKVHVVVPESIIGDSFGFVDRMGAEIRSGVPVINRHREVEIIRTLEYHVPRVLPEPEKVSFEACYATPGCLIASKRFTLADVMGES